MQSPIEKDIEAIFHKYSPNDVPPFDANALVLFKKEILLTYQQTPSPDNLIESLQKFILSKISKTCKMQYLDLFTQILKEIYSQRRISECLFFPDKENEAKLIEYLKLATKELDLCIFTLTNNALASTLLYLFEEKKVKIRIISDDANLRHMGSDLETLASKIPVRTDRDLFAHMHNKYVVIDKRILITGSFNWTAQAVTRNNENVVILEDEELSLKYVADFERLWKEFEGNQITGKGDLERLRPKDTSQKKRGRKKKEETEESKKEKDEKLRKKQEKKELQEKKKMEKMEKKGKKEKKEKPVKEKKEKVKKEPKEKKVKVKGVEKKIAKREKIPRKVKKNKNRHVSWKQFLARKKTVLERSMKVINHHEEKEAGHRAPINNLSH